MKPEHIHTDYEEDLEDRLRRLIRTEMRSRRGEGAQVDGYTEFPKRFIGWVAAGLMALTVAGVTGLVVLFGEVQALRTSVDDLRHEFERSNAKTVYRGGPDVEPGAH